MADLVVVTPVFLDLTFVGLESLPELGEERFAAELLRSPGGGAITAVAAARLGLEAAIAAPLGDDVAGSLVRAALEDEGVGTIASRPAPRTPTTVVLPFGGDRAMVTVDPGARAQLADVVAAAPRAVAASIDQLYAVPEGTPAYVTCGGDDARAYAGRPPATLATAHALFLSQSEATGLTGRETVEDAARALADLCPTVVVTLGGDGALACRGGELLHVPTERIERPADTTGAGDLLVAAYLWAELHGAPLDDGLRWAVLYATLAVRTPTGVGGAVRSEELLAAGATRGLVPPPSLERPTGAL